MQYHPTGLPFTGILITEATRAEGGWLLNKDGYRYLQDYDLGQPTPTPRLRSMELGPATGCRRRSCTRWRRAGPPTRRTAPSSTSTCVTSARSSTTQGLRRSCASSA